MAKPKNELGLFVKYELNSIIDLPFLKEEKKKLRR